MEKIKLKPYHVYKIGYKYEEGWGSWMTERISICKEVNGDKFIFQDIETSPKDYFDDNNLIWNTDEYYLFGMAISIEDLGNIKEYNKRRV